MKQAINRNIHEIDAAGQAVGRVATQAAMMLMGKNKPGFTPHIEEGDFVTVKNAGKVKFTGKKLVQKQFRHHSMHPGGLKTVSMKKVFDKNPADVIIHAVYGMLPKNNRRDDIIRRLKVIA